MQTLNITKKYEKYPEYKDSGVDWLGKIPKEWKSVKGKTVFNNKKDLNKGMKNNNVLSLTMSGVINRDSENNEGLLPSDYQTFQIFEKNDLVFKLIDLENFKTSRVGIVHEKGIMSSAYIRLILKNNKDFISRYFYYLYYHLYLRGIYNFLGSGVRSTLNSNDLMRMEILIPKDKEQTKIANYLDEKTQLIDEIIEKKEKLIELLKEKRTAVINNAVTKGLDKNVPLVESGVDWIGKIPKGWEVKNLKSGFTFEKGKEAGKFTQEFVGDEKNIGEYPVYSGQTKDGGILGNINSYKYNYPKGVLFSTTVGAKAMTTRFLVGKFSLSQNCVLMVPNEKTDPLYFNYLLEIGFKRMRDDIPSHMQPSLRVSDLNKFIVLFPNVEKQKQIAKYLNEKANNFDITVNYIEKSVELLKEFKTSLISNVVTGKIKV